MLSLEQQRQFFLQFTERNNLDMYGLYVDEGISGKSLKKRENFNRMIEDAKKGLFTKILVKDISRFARNTLDFLGVIRELKRHNVIIEFVTYNMTTMDSEFTLTILAAVAQEESAGLSRRVKFGKKQGAKNGRVPSSVYGYDRVDKFTLTPNSAEAAVVKRIFELYANCQTSSLQIARLLNEECVPTKRGGENRWSQTVICGILKNPLYIGEVCNQKSEIADFLNGSRKKIEKSNWITVERPQFRILPDALFEKAQIIRESRSNSFHSLTDTDGNSNRKRPSIRYPLSNLLYCAEDNYSFRRRQRTYPSGSCYTYWTCSKRDKGAYLCRNTVKIDETQMLTEILHFFFQLFENPEALYRGVQKETENELALEKTKELGFPALLKEKAALKKQRDKIMDVYLDGSLNKEFLTNRLKPIDRRLTEIETTLASRSRKTEFSSDFPQYFAAIMQSVYSKPEKVLNNAFLKTVFEKFTVFPDGTITAALKEKTENGLSLVIPFGKVTSAPGVPKCTDRIQRADRNEPAHG